MAIERPRNRFELNVPAFRDEAPELFRERREVVVEHVQGDLHVTGK